MNRELQNINEWFIQGFGGEKDRICGKFIGSNLVIFVIKNLKNSRSENLLANPNPR